jgi:hypothetical protein
MEQDSLVELNYMKIAALARSKYEIYRIMTFEGCLYLPPKERLDLYFVKSILNGSKKVLMKTINFL